VFSVRTRRFNPWLIAEVLNREDAVALTQTQLVAAVAERADLSKADAKRALGRLMTSCSRSSVTRRRYGLEGWCSWPCA